MWYYQRNNQQVGPVELDDIDNLIKEQKLTRSTKVWCEGMPDWLPANQTELQDRFLRNIPPPIAPPLVSTPPPVKVPQEDDVRRLNIWFMVFWICIAAGIPLSLVLIGVGGLIASYVFFALIIYKLWTIIPVNEAKTTPGKAVGFLFIPFFNCYWNFIAVHGLAQALNSEMTKHSINNQKINEELTLAYCIIVCVSLVTAFIPYLNFLVPIAQLVILIIALKQLKDAGIALIEKSATVGQALKKSAKWSRHIRGGFTDTSNT